MTVLVLLDLELKSDDLEASYAGIEATLAETRERDGAVSVDTWIDDSDPTRLIVIETWETNDALASYRQWRAGDGAPHQMIAALAAPPRSRSFTNHNHSQQ
jgi:quinol monooxygenase YgiN